MDSLRNRINLEIVSGDKSLENGDLLGAFEHLERAHVLGQGITREHTRVHWRMMKLGWMKKDLREIFGQLIRIVGASTKTPFGIYPKGTTGGANVWFFKRLPIAADLQQIFDSAIEQNSKRA